MYLHENRELFQEIIESASEALREDIEVVEKDYYVTMILKLLSEKLENVVFKGGTSLSKGYHAINRFSEDIDITFDSHIGEGKRKALKYKAMQKISGELKMPIANWESIESDKDYNYYLFSYEPISAFADDSMCPSVKVETALASYAFPTVVKEIDSYVRIFLDKDNQDIIEEYGLGRFEMKLQAIERTYIDKVFALCDYYMEGKSKRYSRHLYDIYKLQKIIIADDRFRNLVSEVRLHRVSMKICPSAKQGADIRKIVHEFVENDFFKEDYEQITNYFLSDYVSYKEVTDQICELVDTGLFDE